MSHYRRSIQAGGYFFFTVVTHQRRPILTDTPGRSCFHNAWKSVQQRRPFRVIALCLLPEHLHCIWQLPTEDNDYSYRWSAIKAGFTTRYLAAGGCESSQSHSRQQRRHRGIWQKRFWEHRLRSEEDLQHHVDYIHYNPVKHCLVNHPAHWPWSTIHQPRWRQRYDNFDWTGIMALTDDQSPSD